MHVHSSSSMRDRSREISSRCISISRVASAGHDASIVSFSFLVLPKISRCRCANRMPLISRRSSLISLHTTQRVSPASYTQQATAASAPNEGDVLLHDAHAFLLVSVGLLAELGLERAHGALEILALTRVLVLHINIHARIGHRLADVLLVQVANSVLITGMSGREGEVREKRGVP